MKPKENPPEFNMLTAFFLPYADKLYSSLEEMIDDGWEQLTPRQRKVARDFLDEILSGDYREDQLHAIWRATQAALIPFRGRHRSCRKLFELIRSRYEAGGFSERSAEDDTRTDAAPKVKMRHNKR
jgi:hypothetical protein